MAAGQDAANKPEGVLWETVKVIVQALLIAFFVRTFLYQPFNIPSGSMYPTLKEGDYLFVSKLSYGYGEHSFDFAPSFFGRELIRCCPIEFDGRVFFADTPKRGDIAVFKLPTNTDIDYIKRVIGLPGDRIKMIAGVLHLNGEPVRKEPAATYSDPDVEQGSPVQQYIETLPNGISYHVLDFGDIGPMDNTDERMVAGGEYVVPPGHYFMMGDNRDNSQDSRVLDEVGYVPIENFVGRADIIFFSISPDTPFWQVWKWPFAIRWSRFFNLL